MTEKHVGRRPDTGLHKAEQTFNLPFLPNNFFLQQLQEAGPRTHEIEDERGDAFKREVGVRDRVISITDHYPVPGDRFHVAVKLPALDARSTKRDTQLSVRFSCRYVADPESGRTDVLSFESPSQNSIILNHSGRLECETVNPERFWHTLRDLDGMPETTRQRIQDRLGRPYEQEGVYGNRLNWFLRTVVSELRRGNNVRTPEHIEHESHLLPDLLQ